MPTPKIPDLPGNSFNEKDKEKKPKKIITGTVRQQKKSTVSRFRETFLAEDLRNVLGFIAYDVIVPAIKSTISDMLSMGVERLLYGGFDSGRHSSAYKRDQARTIVSYGDMYRGDRMESTPYRRKGSSRSQYNRKRRNTDDLIFNSRGDAEVVLNQMMGIVEEYGAVTIAEMKEMVGVVGAYTDNDYGWENLSQGNIVRSNNGWVLSLPSPIKL